MEDVKYKIMNNHWYNEGKEIINQGRSKKQYESSAIGAFYKWFWFNYHFNINSYLWIICACQEYIMKLKTN